MKGKLIVAFALTLFSFTTMHAAQEVPTSGSNLGSVSGGVFKEAHMVIDRKCVSCHTAERIEQAVAAGKNMQKIQHRMEQKGVQLTADEQTVLGIFYKQTPFKPKK